MRVYHDFVLVPGSKSAFPDTDPDPDPKHWLLVPPLFELSSGEPYSGVRGD